MNTPIPLDPYRIKRILNKLERVWSHCGCHLSMLIDDLFHPPGYIAMMGDWDTDEKLEKRLDIYLKDHSVSQWKS